MSEIRWFAWREIQPAIAHAKDGGIALHYFRYDLRRFGLGRNDPACHVLGTDADVLTAFVGQFGLPAWTVQEPRPHRPEIWHFDAFGFILTRLVERYPLPEHIATDDT